MEYSNELWMFGSYLLGTVVGYKVFSKTQTAHITSEVLSILDNEGIISLDRETGDISPVYREEQYDEMLDRIMEEIDRMQAEEKGKDEDRL